MIKRSIMRMATILALGSCGGTGSSNVTAVFLSTDASTPLTTLTESTCPDTGAFKKCNTPSEFKLYIKKIETVDCLPADCTLNSNNSDFSDVRKARDPITFDELMSVLPSTSLTKAFVGRHVGGISLFTTYMETKFPSTVEGTYSGASFITCFVAGCKEGASVGDILITLSGSADFKWYNLDDFQLTSTRPTNPLRHSPVVSGTTSLGEFTSEGWIIPITLPKTFEGTSADITGTVDIGLKKNFHCVDSSDNGSCEPSIGETFWSSLPTSFSLTVANTYQ